jgi:hypothetical protein
MLNCTRWLKLGYCTALATVLAVMLAPRPATAQRSMIAPGLSMSVMIRMPYVMQTQMMLMSAGIPASMGVGGGMAGSMGGAAGMGGMGGMGGAPGMMGGGMGGMGGMMGMGGMNMGGMGGMPGGGMMGFAGKGMGGFNGKKAL